MDRRVNHLHLNRSLNCVLEVVQCICIIISDQSLLLWLLLCSHFIESDCLYIWTKIGTSSKFESR